MKRTVKEKEVRRLIFLKRLQKDMFVSCLLFLFLFCPEEFTGKRKPFDFPEAFSEKKVSSLTCLQRSMSQTAPKKINSSPDPPQQEKKKKAGEGGSVSKCEVGQLHASTKQHRLLL